MSETELRTKLAALTPSELQALAYDWQKAARPSQMAPAGDWANWVVKAGRGFGKTRTGAETVRQWIKDGFRRVNIIVRTKGDIEKVLVQSKGGILNVCPPPERPTWVGNKNLFRWPNGATSFVFTAEEPDSLRGPEHEKLWCDELAAWRYDEEAWDMAQLGLRIGKSPQAIITTTPRPTKLIRQLLASPNTVLSVGTTYENRANLAERFYSAIIRKYEGTRLGRQELLAEVLDDNPGALFRMADIEGARVAKMPPLVRIVVPLDPAVTSSEDSDEWGIVPVGQDGRDPPHYYVLEDLSGIYSPNEASRLSVQTYHRLQADRIIGEANNGGDMIEALLRHQDANVAYRKVTASRGKVIRAEPIASLYEQHRVHHVGTLSKLEDELTQWNPQTDERSPNRLDSVVWGLTELAAGGDGFLGYAKDEAKGMAAAGHIAPVPGSRIDIEGGNRDRCECGSVIWVADGGKQVCWKCKRPRPEC